MAHLGGRSSWLNPDDSAALYDAPINTISNSTSIPDTQRRHRLRQMRTVATGLLVMAAVVVAWTYMADSDATWVGYVRAAAEAAMIGAIADWFAVTAIFRHPLGLPIPHTALIPRGKDAVGRGLGEFIHGNFLHPDEVKGRVLELKPAARVGAWLSNPENAAAAASQLADWTTNAVELLDQDELQQSVESIITVRARSIPFAALLGGGIERIMASGLHHALVDSVLHGIDQAIVENRDVLRHKLGQESPWWVPATIDDAVFDKLMDGLHSLIADLLADPEHDLRADLDRRARQLADDLKGSPQIVARVEAFREDLMGHPEFGAWAAGLWTRLKDDLVEHLASPSSGSRQRLAVIVEGLGNRLQTDEDLQRTVDTWVATTTRRTLEAHGRHLVRLVESTVERWDTQETVSKIELLVGRDLQYIRINGTIIGAIVGLFIHAVATNFA